MLFESLKILYLSIDKAENHDFFELSLWFFLLLRKTCNRQTAHDIPRMSTVEAPFRVPYLQKWSSKNWRSGREYVSQSRKHDYICASNDQPPYQQPAYHNIRQIFKLNSFVSICTLTLFFISRKNHRIFFTNNKKYAIFFW